MLAISRLSNACKYLTCTVIGSRLDTAKNFFSWIDETFNRSLIS